MTVEREQRLAFAWIGTGLILGGARVSYASLLVPDMRYEERTIFFVLVIFAHYRFFSLRYPQPHAPNHMHMERDIQEHRGAVNGLA